MFCSTSAGLSHMQNARKISEHIYKYKTSKSCISKSKVASIVKKNLHQYFCQNIGRWQYYSNCYMAIWNCSDNTKQHGSMDDGLMDSTSFYSELSLVSAIMHLWFAGIIMATCFEWLTDRLFDALTPTVTNTHYYTWRLFSMDMQ